MKLESTSSSIAEGIPSRMSDGGMNSSYRHESASGRMTGCVSLQMIDGRLPSSYRLWSQ